MIVCYQDGKPWIALPFPGYRGVVDNLYLWDLVHGECLTRQTEGDIQNHAAPFYRGAVELEGNANSS
jgi:hypothetical protein